MLTYPTIDPIAFHLGPLPVHWYGLMYLIGFMSAWALLAWRLRTSNIGFTADQLSDIIFYGALGTIIGGRLGYVLFYDWPQFISQPLQLFKIWQGGMSFHGGLLGVLVAMTIFARKYGKTFLEVTDFISPVVPIGLAAGRIGNFINGELWGRVTDVPWAMIFPNAGNLPRHPSPLYEFLLEGVLLFLILWFFSSKPKPRGAVSGLFALCYGTFRIIAECFREPDVQIGFLVFGLTEGQLLSIPLVIVGIGLLVWAYRGKKSCSNI